MNLDAYLARIRYDGPLAVDARTLAALQRAHLFAVPFENLSIMWGEAIELDDRKHYEKIVERRRGGFCYEQNGLFAWALGEIGFRVSRLGAAVWSAREGIGSFGDSASHLLLKVELDEPWIADVGFGENFRAPLRLVDGLVQDEAPRAFRLDRHRDGDGDGGENPDAWTLYTRDAHGIWTKDYRFADIARPLDYFAAMCRFHQTSPLSPFTQKRLCSLATPTGRITLSGDEWIVSSLDGSRSVTPIADDEEAGRRLKERFGIDTPVSATRPSRGRMNATDYSTILYAEADGIARITLNRADKLNSFSDEMFREIQEALDRVEASAAREGGARVLVLTGAGRGFCAGADLSAIDPDDIGATDLGAMLERNYNPLILRLRALPVPVLCAVNGVAAGAGASLALAGDITLAAKSASFVLAFARIGLVPDAGATFFLPQRIGKARAAGLSMLGEKVDAETAERWGLVWKCIDDAEFASTVDAYATRLASAPTRALLATRALLNAAESSTLEEQLSAERSAQSDAGREADFHEGVTAFRDKRPARFKGR